MKPTAGIDGCLEKRKSLDPARIEPQTIQAIASCYTDYTVPASEMLIFSIIF